MEGKQTLVECFPEKLLSLPLPSPSQGEKRRDAFSRKAAKENRVPSSSNFYEEALGEGKKEEGRRERVKNALSLTLPSRLKMGKRGHKLDWPPSPPSTSLENGGRRGRKRVFLALLQRKEKR